MGAELYQFAAHEEAALDLSRLAVLRQSLGDRRCREVVEEVVFHLTDRLGLLRTALDTSDATEAQILASRLASLSEQVGLCDFARVARDLGSCLALEDGHSTTAVAARLMRLGEESLLTVMLYAEHMAL
jgi:hypothetical protein